jgi:hypothetical protein
MIILFGQRRPGRLFLALHVPPVAVFGADSGQAAFKNRPAKADASVGRLGSDAWPLWLASPQLGSGFF